MKTSIIGIDPGASGGIAVFHNGKIGAVKMPKNVKEMNSYMAFLNRTYPNSIVFIEKVQAYRGAQDDAPGKKFGINKMLANYTQLLTVIQLNGFEFVEVYPISWQSKLGLRIKKDKRTKTERKRSYKEYAQRCFPELKVTLATCDALCLIQFGLLKTKNEPEWIRDKSQNKPTSGLF